MSATVGPARSGRRDDPDAAEDAEAGPPATAGRGRDAGPVTGALALLDRPLTSYYLVLGCTLLLLALGLVMVLSTSSAVALDSGAPPFGAFEKQLLGAALGLPLMWLVAKFPPRLFRAFGYPLLGLSVLGLLLVLVKGTTVDGAERWINLPGMGGVQLQPSEFAKLAFVIWGADLLARKEKLGLLTDWRQLLIPLLPGAAILSMLVMLGNDLGTTFILVVIFLALLWVIGTPARLLGGMIGLMVFVMLVLAVVAPYRAERLTGFLSAQAHSSSQGYQQLQGEYSVGSGGVFGVGLGAGRQKWGWVPNSTTDFIFAILGEELGLVGTLCVTFLYGGLAYGGLRIARRVQDPFMRLAAAATTMWIVLQALVNIGAVIGLLPITGIPLPLISEGLSSLLVTMLALGMLMAFARHEPGARQALAAAGPSVPRRVLSWLGLGRARN